MLVCLQFSVSLGVLNFFYLVIKFIDNHKLISVIWQYFLPHSGVLIKLIDTEIENGTGDVVPCSH